jgi:hypothetical protein
MPGHGKLRQDCTILAPADREALRGELAARSGMDLATLFPRTSGTWLNTGVVLLVHSQATSFGIAK